MILILYILTFLQFNYGHGIKTCSEPLCCGPNITINCSIIECLTDSIDQINYNLTNKIADHTIMNESQPLPELICIRSRHGLIDVLEGAEEYNGIHNYKYFRSSDNKNIHVFPVKDGHADCSSKTFLLNHHYEGCHNQFLGFKKICFQQNNYFVSINSELNNSTHNKFNVYVRHLSNSATSGEPIEVLVKWSDNKEMQLVNCNESDVDYSFKCENNISVDHKDLDEPFDVYFTTNAGISSRKIRLKSSSEYVKCNQSNYYCNGSTPGCVNQNNCYILVSIHFSRKNIEFNITSWVDPTYRGLDYSVSAVISDDEKEGDDLEITCSSNNDLLIATFNGINISNIEKMVKNDKISKKMPYLCSIKTDYIFDISTDKNYKLDLTKSFHLMLTLKIEGQIVDKTGFMKILIKKPLKPENKFEDFLIIMAAVIGVFVLLGSFYLFLSSPGPAEDSRSMSSKKNKEKRKAITDAAQESKKIKEIEIKKVKLVPEYVSGEDAKSSSPTPITASKISEDKSEYDENAELECIESVDDIVTSIVVKRKSTTAPTVAPTVIEQDKTPILTESSTPKLIDPNLVPKDAITKKIDSKEVPNLKQSSLKSEIKKSTIEAKTNKDNVVDLKSTQSVNSTNKSDQKSTSVVEEGQKTNSVITTGKSGQKSVPVVKDGTDSKTVKASKILNPKEKSGQKAK